MKDAKVIYYTFLEQKEMSRTLGYMLYFARSIWDGLIDAIMRRLSGYLSEYILDKETRLKESSYLEGT